MADERDEPHDDTTAEQTWDDGSPDAATEASTTDESAAAAEAGFRGGQTPAASGLANESVRAEHERLQAERAARREARLAALHPTPVPPVAARPATDADAAPAVEVREVVTEKVRMQRNTDRFLPSLGLFVLRLTTALIFGVHGVNKLLNLPGTTDMIGRTLLPSPSVLAVVVGAAEVAIAIALVFGLLTRVASLGVVGVSAGALVFVLWGPTWSPFQPGQAGFVGELELLLAAVGLLLMCTGGGGWAVDRGFRARRAADRAARES